MVLYAVDNMATEQLLFTLRTHISIFYCNSRQAMFIFGSKWLVLVACLTSNVGVLGNELDGVGSGIRGAGADAATAGPKDGEVRIIRISCILLCCVKSPKLRTKLLV
jgi:hypothetical protein